jgi:N utilization substance protein A
VGSPHFSAYNGSIFGETGLMAKNEFILAFNEVLEEKQLPKDIILSALESAMVSAYRRAVNVTNAQHVEAKVDPETGHVQIFAEKEVVDVVQVPTTEVTVEEAKRYNPEAEAGMMVVVETTPGDFGRVAAQTARQVIQQRIRDAERQMQIAFFEKQIGEIVSGIVQAVNAQGLTIGLDMKAEGTMPRKEMIGGERFRIHDRVRSLIAEVKDAQRGPQIILSRTHRNFLRRLLENEVPEIYHGVVEIRSIAREPGQRAKVAVSATQQGIDPVGACVGIRGVRIQAIVRELHDEKIDVIEWNNDPAVYIAKAISPARVSGVYLNEHSPNGKTATVVVPEDQLSLAIGRDGQNARLAAKLTGWRIDIKSLPEAAVEAFDKLNNDPAFTALAQTESAVIPEVETLLAKKADGRPLTQEEYDVITRFVDRVERRTAAQFQAEKIEADETEKEIFGEIPQAELDKGILDVGLPEHVAYILQEAGFTNAGELLLRYKTQPDDILRLQGIGPKAMQEIAKFVDVLSAMKESAAEEVIPETLPEVEVPVEIEAAVLEADTTTAEVLENVEIEVKVPEGEEEVEEPSFDKLFTLKPEIVIPAEAVEEEEEDDSKKGKKKKKSKHVEVVYDPDRDMTLVTKKHKRGDGDWDWEG